MNKIVRELTQIAMEIININPNFEQIEQKLNIIEQKLDK